MSFQCAGKKTPKGELSLSNKWVLVELSGFDFELNGPKGEPTIEFQLSESSYFGYSGCNSYRGEVKASDNEIKLQPALMTKLGCVDNGLEKAFMNSLHEANSFVIDSRQLKLMNGNEVFSIFKKAD